VDITRPALDNRVAVTVAVLLVGLFGAISLFRLPIQLTPEIQEPEITVTTPWRAAAPEEVEAEIVEPQEDAFRGLPGMTRLVATAQRGQGEINITFAVGTNMDRALLEVLNRLNRVPRYPADADEPVINSIGGDSRPVAWFIVKPQPGNDRDIQSYQDYIEEVVQTRFERVPGVAQSEVFGGRREEVRVTFDPYRAASLGVELPVAAELAGGAEDVTAGFTDVGKRRYTVRFAGKYRVDELADLIVEWRDGRPVRLADVADVEVRMVDRDSFVIQNGDRSMAVNAHRETGVNVLEVMAGLRQAAADLGDGPLKRAGLGIEQVYDETTYIDASITMVQTNLLIGMVLATAVLWWFLRRFRATLMVALAIPICLLASFNFMFATGRTLNVISLAGLAFATGMVLDAAIVVLENIVRLRERGMQPLEAAYKGTTEVWGALLASTATTVAIFLPIVFLEEEAGQLFADLALAITGAIICSLLVAVAVIPAATSKWLAHAEFDDPHHAWWERLSDAVMRITGTPARRYAWIAGLIIVPLAVIVLAFPRMGYLPEGNRDLVFAFILPPPGSNIETIEKEMGGVISAAMAPRLRGEKEPAVENYFFVAFSRGVFMGARTADPDDTGKLVPLINGIIQGFPGTFGSAFRASLFGGFGGAAIDMDIQGRDIDAVLATARAGYGMVSGAIPGATIQPIPGLELAEPELRMVPNERRIAEAGWNRPVMAQISRALGDGLFVGEYFDGERKLDVILRAQPWSTPEELGAIPLATPGAGVQPVSELTRLERTAGPDQIQRIDRRRTATLRVRLPEGRSLEESLEILKTEVEPKLVGMLPEDGAIVYSGAAEKLGSAIKSMSGSLILAIIILYLLMSALFRSFVDSLLPVVVIPLALVGGVVALDALVLWLKYVPEVPVKQELDLLTMIGAIILLGLIVNNAILLVHQTRAAEREGLSRREAVSQAVHRRLRPILMTTLTSIGGMLPLLLNPGAGTELYRGIAAVIVGGMAVSTAFTLILLPALLQLGSSTREAAPQISEA
jgi:multidrug efflux pump subunit AcrB